MSGQDGPGREGPDSSSEDSALSERLRKLGDRLDRSRIGGNAASERRTAGGNQGFAQAMRLGADFVAGVIVGAGIGLALDWWLATSPWGLIVFLLLGFCAGVLNVLRSAGLVAQPRDIGGPRKDG